MWEFLCQSLLPNSGHYAENLYRTHLSRGSRPSPTSVVPVAGALFVTLDAIDPFRTQARLTALASKACLAEAWAAHVVTFPSVDALAGLSTADSICADRTLILAPIKQGQERKIDYLVPCQNKQSIQVSFVIFKLNLLFGFDIYLVIIPLQVWKALRWVTLATDSSNSCMTCSKK